MTIGPEDFKKLEIRVGTIMEVRDFPAARKPAFQLDIDFGPYGKLCSSAQITTLYDKQALRGRQVAAVINFPPKQIAHYWSQCLVLGVADERGNIVLLEPERPMSNGVEVK
ncbi:MAG: tRNA-binding protein [Bacteroidetes bacterium]|nr:tRNA-binding protein [Bacteroidota bacterium]